MVKAKALIEKFREALKEKWGYIWGTSGELWTEEKQKALEKTTDSDRAPGRKYGRQWIGRHVADCSGLFVWAFRQLGGSMYHGSDTMYMKWCTDKGTLKAGKRSDNKPLRPGTAVFVWNGQKYSHVGLYVGDGIVIEAMGTRNGVTTTKVSAGKWTHWGELRGVTFDATESVVGATLRKGDRGEEVKTLQTLLNGYGYDLGSAGIDGDFGPVTEAAVKLFQKDRGLTVDGVVGVRTWKALQAAMFTYRVSIPHLKKQEAEKLCSEYRDASMTKE